MKFGQIATNKRRICIDWIEMVSTLITGRHEVVHFILREYKVKILSTDSWYVNLGIQAQHAGVDSVNGNNLLPISSKVKRNWRLVSVSSFSSLGNAYNTFTLHFQNLVDNATYIYRKWISCAYHAKLWKLRYTGSLWVLLPMIKLPLLSNYDSRNFFDVSIHGHRQKSAF